MDTVYRYFAALYASRAVSEYLKECRTVVAKMTGNPNFPDTTPPLPLVTSHLDTLEAAEQAAHHGPKGSAAARDVALLVVRGDMRQLKSCVQVAADANITQSKAIIEGAGMYVSRRTPKAKPPIAVRHGVASGLVDLTCKAIKGQGSYQWQMSGDGKAWTDLSPTTKTATTVAGLTPATVYYFRFRTLTNDGFSDWSVPVDIIAH